ncbi:MAG: amidohydrolase family protein [Deltaproteobacteria bacterium]|nr:amidohydrolase family protein [Deltaproteobacteria bacterium]
MAGGEGQLIDLAVVNGTVVTPAGSRAMGIGVRDGRIVAIAPSPLLPRAREVIDAAGKFVMPGVVDPEAHLGTGTPLKEDVITETRAAAVGGVTTWGIQNPSPRMGPGPFKPEVDPADVVSFRKVLPFAISLFEEHSMVDVFFTPQMETEEQASEIEQVAREFGVTSYKFYLHCKRPELDQFWGTRRRGLAAGFDDGVVYLALEAMARVGPPGVICFHPENWEIVRVLEKRLIGQGRMDMAAWSDRSPHFCEAHHVRSYAYLARVTGCPIYFVHVTTPESVEEIWKARAEGARITAQTGPQYLYMRRGEWKLNVPLRDEAAIEQLWRAVRDGDIDCLGSDHVLAVGRREEMEVKGDVWRTKSGYPSRVEATLSIMLSEGVNQGRLSFERLVELYCENPARAFGLYPRKGAIEVGADADLVIVDRGRQETIRREMIHGRPGWSLYEGRTLKGWPVMTILRGQVIMRWKDGDPRAEIVGKPQGRYLRRIPGAPRYPLALS